MREGTLQAGKQPRAVLQPETQHQGGLSRSCSGGTAVFYVHQGLLPGPDEDSMC